MIHPSNAGMAMPFHRLNWTVWHARDDFPSWWLRPPSSTTLVPDRRGLAAVVLFVISAAAPLTAVGGVAPPRLALTGLTGVSHAYLAVAVVVALFSVDDVATARHITNAAAPYASIARGMSRPAGVGASCVGLSAYTLFECASYRGFGAIARLACNSFRRFSDVATTVR